MRAQLSARTYLAGLILVVVTPLLLFSGFLVIRSTKNEQDAIVMAVRNRTRMAAAAIEDELGSLRARLFVLGGGLSLQTSDLGDFHTRAQAAFPGMAVVLANAAGQEILNSTVPFGTPLPMVADRAAISFVATHGQPRIADMSLDPVTHQRAVTINIPVTRDSRLVYVLSVDIASTLPRILARLELPDGWIAAIFDRRGYMIARSRLPDLYIGQRGGESFVKQILTETEGSFYGVSREGIPLYSAFARTRLGDWTINVGIPRDTLLAPIRETTWNLVFLGAATLALAVAAAWVIGRRIAQPITGLVPVAEAVGRGEAAPLRISRLYEANVVAGSLYHASERLQHAAAERKAHTEALRQSEQKYRALAVDLARIDADRTALLNRSVVAQEEERKRIARELHDSLAQYLTALRLGIDALDSRDRTPRREPVERLKALIGELGRTVSRMAWELRPVALGELGLDSAVQNYLEEWSERAQLPVDVEVKLGDAALPAVVETTLFRVLQEATTNVVRHAHASQVSVILERRGDAVQLIVEDDGKGFPSVANGVSVPESSRFGLIGMRERLALVHGSLEVESSPDSGTTLFIRIPLVQEHDAS